MPLGFPDRLYVIETPEGASVAGTYTYCCPTAARLSGVEVKTRLKLLLATTGKENTKLELRPSASVSVIVNGEPVVILAELGVPEIM